MSVKLFFGQLEQAIMDVAWDSRAVTVRDVLQALPRRSTAYTTVMTVMNRLVDHGYLRRRMRNDGAYRYQPVASRQTQYASIARKQAAELVKHYGDAALVQFLDTLDRVPSEKLSQLKRQLKRRRP